MPDSTASEPVTVSVARRILPGREQDYEDWVKGVSTVAAQFPGHMGVNVLRPSPATKGAYVLIYRFDSYAHGQAWEESEDRALWVGKLAGMTEGEATYKKVTGLEFWFDLPEMPAEMKPSPHKMALVLIVVVFVLVYALQLTLGEWLADGPFWLRVLAVVTVQVLLMTYVVMPRVTRLLKGWLYGAGV